MNCGQCGWTGMNCGNNCPKCRCTLRGPLNPTPTPPMPCQQRGRVEVCEACDPCEPCESMVRICTFVVPTLSEGRWFRNSFIFVQDEEATYYISDNGDEIPFGSRPMFRENFDPTAVELKSQVVYDVNNKMMWVFNPLGEYVASPLGGDTPTPPTPTGLHMERGTIDMSGATIEVKFANPFLMTPTVVTTVVKSDSPAIGAVIDTTTTGFKLMNSTSQDATFNWIAIGE